MIKTKTGPNGASRAGQAQCEEVPQESQKREDTKPSHRAELSDAHIIQRYQAGESSVFSLLLDRYKNKVYTTIYMIVRDRYLAEDLMQEVFIKAIDKLRASSYTEEGKFGPWIGRIAHNMAIDHFRKAKKHPEILTEDGKNVFVEMTFTADSITDRHDSEDRNAMVRQLIEQLPANQKEVVIMRHFAEMSFAEIAEETGVSINTALGRMRYALLNLRKLYQQTKTPAYEYKPNTT